MKASVNKDTCIGCGLCVDVCGPVFSMDDAWKAEAKPGAIDPANQESCRQAAADCPVTAIIVEDN